MFTLVLWKSAVIGQSTFYYISVLTALLVTLKYYYKWGIQGFDF